MLLAALIAAAVCTATLPVLVPVLRRGAVLDHPGFRSSHTVPTPRGGGIALALGITMAALVTDRSRVTATVVAGLIVAGLVGLAEDLRGVPIGRRLVVHLFVGLTLVSIMPFDRPVWRVVVGAVVLTLVVVAVINAVNFMDGINGISAATGLVGGLAYAAIGSSAHDHSLVILGAAVAAASAAFAPWNVPRARVFLGDVGSYALGAALAGCLVVAVRAGQPLEAAVGPLALYFADTGTVLARRLVRREPWREPHRLHAYQRLTDTGLSHAAVSAAVLVCTAAVSGLGLVSLGDRFSSRLFADLLAAALIAGYLVSPSLRRAAVQA